MTLPCGLTIPLYCLTQVVRNGLPFDVHFSNFILGGGIATFSLGLEFGRDLCTSNRKSQHHSRQNKRNKFSQFGHGIPFPLGFLIYFFLAL